MRLSQRQACAIFGVFTAFQRQILAVPADTRDNQSLDNRNSGENAVGIDIDARTATASSSTINYKPSLIIRTHGEDPSSNLKRGSKTGDEPSNGEDSDKKAKEKERWDKIRKKALITKKENEERRKALKAKGAVYKLYDSNDIGEA